MYFQQQIVACAAGVVRCCEQQVRCPGMRCCNAQLTVHDCMKLLVAASHRSRTHLAKHQTPQFGIPTFGARVKSAVNPCLAAVRSPTPPGGSTALHQAGQPRQQPCLRTPRRSNTTTAGRSPRRTRPMRSIRLAMRRTACSSHRLTHRSATCTLRRCASMRCSRSRAGSASTAEAAAVAPSAHAGCGSEAPPRATRSTAVAVAVAVAVGRAKWCGGPLRWTRSSSWSARSSLPCSA